MNYKALVTGVAALLLSINAMAFNVSTQDYALNPNIPKPCMSAGFGGINGVPLYVETRITYINSKLVFAPRLEIAQLWPINFAEYNAGLHLNYVTQRTALTTSTGGHVFQAQSFYCGVY